MKDSSVEHALLLISGGRLSGVTLALFNVYIDDSGTAPSQRIAVASALIIPARRVVHLESEWKKFRAKYEISDFHASECVACNPKSQFSSWGSAKVRAAVADVRRMTMKYAVKAISFAVTKKDYDEEMPDDLKAVAGKYHYTWAIHHVLQLIRVWKAREKSRTRLEYAFDNLKDAPRREVDRAMSQEEINHPGHYEGHYFFRIRKEWAALQCVDLLAWSSFNAARLTFENAPINPVAKETMRAYRARGLGWLDAKAVSRANLRKSIQEALAKNRVAS